MPDDVITVALLDLIDVLQTRTKMRRAPTGAKSIGLREAVIVPGNGAVTFEMPSMTQDVSLIDGSLSTKVIFATKHLPDLIALLKSYVGQEEVARIEVSPEQIRFCCAGSRRILLRLKG